MVLCQIDTEQFGFDVINKIYDKINRFGKPKC